MWDQIYRADRIKSGPAPFPGTKGKPTVQVVNADPALGPGLLRIVMFTGNVDLTDFKLSEGVE